MFSYPPEICIEEAQTFQQPDFDADILSLHRATAMGGKLPFNFAR
jgi:hypothetical protein